MSARVRDYTVRPCSGNSALLLPASSALYLTRILVSLLFFFLNDTAPPEISPLPLPDALPFSCGCADLLPRRGASPRRAPSALRRSGRAVRRRTPGCGTRTPPRPAARRLRRTRRPLRSTDRKSTRLNSSHLGISYAVFCLKKKY